jgi:hypothetical protein
MPVRQAETGQNVHGQLLYQKKSLFTIYNKTDRRCPSTTTKPDVSRKFISATIDMIPLRLQGGYFLEANDFEWPTQPIPAAAHRADSHVLQ